ncbi:MAG: acyl carrier protein [Lachnospiraceae bacterium]
MKNKTEKEIMEGINSVLHEEMIFVDSIDEQTDLREYIIDSIQFVNFIVDLENYFGIQIDDGYLNYDLLQSIGIIVNAVKNS